MRQRIARPLNDQLLDIVDHYLDQGGSVPIDLDDLARFAINNGHWMRHGSALIQLCKRDFSRAMREQYHTDLQDRRVRTYHAAKRRGSGGEQKVFWADMRDAPPEHMQLAFHQRRTQIVGDCVQLKRDVDSYNENNQHGIQIQMVFDFRDDIAEREQPADYRPNRPR